MKMATKLTKAFAAFVGERGFEIVNEDEISQRPGEDYKLARQIVCTIHDNIPAKLRRRVCTTSNLSCRSTSRPTSMPTCSRLYIDSCHASMR